ncbi:NAD-dependent epimerase/dehydratase family protein [Priestia megaterium]
MKRVLVTGGCGFIGSHMAELLYQNGFEVKVIDNLSTGKIANIENRGISFHYGDIVSEELDKVFAEFKPHYVVHQAAQVSVAHSVTNFHHDANVNIQGTINIINACKKHGTEKIIFASSAAVYGNTNVTPISLTHPTSPASPYGLSKFTSEEYLKLAKQLYDIDYVILRYSNVYGPRQNSQGEGGVISIFFDRFVTNQQPIIYGSGRQTRDFIYVEDVSQACLQAIQYEGCGTFNISNNSSISINELFFTMKSISGSQLTPAYHSVREGDIADSRLCNKESIKLLKWSPAFTLEKGLAKTYDYYHETLAQQFAKTME